MNGPVRIAMWSGPRNISTAMLRSFGNRPDAFVTDEPLYAYYLNASGSPHPMREEVIASQSTDWREVTEWLTGPVPGGKPVWYQKHMTHHLLDEVGRDWLDGVKNCFLLRDPRAVLASYAQKREERVLVEDVGMVQQAAIFDEVVARNDGEIPPVIDAAEILGDPAAALALLCERVGIPFDGHMLSWPPGRRETDGVWARHWYQAVEASTGFQPYRPPPEELPEELEAIARECQPAYERLRRHALIPA
jgi:hypothetical protein